MIIPKKPKTENPVLFDKLIVELQDHLETELPWLDYIFGQAQVLVTAKERGREYKYPGIHIKNGEYVNVLPDQKLGNVCFMLLHDPVDVQASQTQLSDLTVKYSLVFWYNLIELFPGSTDRNSEAVKADILKALTTTLALKTGRLTVTAMRDKAENIFKEFSLKEIENQHLMQPYAGLRIEGELKLRNICLV